MIRILLALVFLLPVLGWADPRKPANKSGVEPGVELRLIKPVYRYVFMAETKSRKEITDETYSQVMLGGYYRITKRWRLGYFGQGEQGLRWDDDWHRFPDKWDWQSSQGRWDFSSVLDSTYMDNISTRLLYEVKARLFYYHSRNALQFRIRPGLRYFVLREGRPVWQYFTALEAYAPVNYGEGPLYEAWLYLGALHQFTGRLALGPTVSYRRRWLRSYEDFEDRSGVDFESVFDSVNIGLTAVYTW